MGIKRAGKKTGSWGKIFRGGLSIRPRGNPLAWIGGGWALAFLSLLSLLNFHPVVNTEGSLGTPIWIILPELLGGMALMIIGYRGLPERESPDLGGKAAWAWLAVILAAGAFLRLYHLGQPPLLYNDDWATTLVWVHVMLDKNKFFWMMPSDGIEPFNPYVITALQSVVPDEWKDIVVRRVASCVIDLTALWVLYLAGKEWGSRRTGLIAAGLGALGRPMIQLTVTGMRAYTLSLAVGFLLLATLKLLRKPSLPHFLLWGFALAFGVHTYSSFRVFMILTPFLLLPWALRGGGKNKTFPWDWPAAGGCVLLLAGVYSGTFAATTPLFAGWAGVWEGWASNPWLIGGLFLIVLAGSLAAVWVSGRRGTPSRLAGWSLAVGLACLLIFPLTLSAEFNGRLGGLSQFHQEKPLLEWAGFLAGQAWQTFKSLFHECLDRNDLKIANDPFFDLFSQGALLLGFAYFSARPGWKKGYLLALGALGTLVYVLSVDPASTKLVASAPPLYLLAAAGLSRLWAGLPKATWRGFPRPALLFAVLLAAYGAAGFGIQMGKIWGYWAKIPDGDGILAENIGKDEKNFRVYVAPFDWFFGWNAQLMLNEGRRYYTLMDTNIIPVPKGEAPEDLVVFISGLDNPTQALFHAQFPGSRWEMLNLRSPAGLDPSNPDLYMWRVMIPGGEITADPSQVIYRVEQGGDCLRRFYNGRFGWCLGGILREERAPGFSSPLPPDLSEDKRSGKNNFASPRLGQFLGSFEAPRDGDYEWASDFSDPLWFRIDGDTPYKRDAREPGKGVSFTVHLKKGEHPVEIRARFPDRYWVPIFHWKEAGSGPQNTL